MLPEFWLENGITVAFYVLVILLIIIYRKKFEFQGRIIALRKTKIGIKWINKFATKHAELLKVIGYSGIGIGFAGMLFILWYVIKGLYTLFVQPAAPATFALVLPGVNVPGSPIAIPLWVLIPLFIVVLIHEAGHGVIAKAHKIAIRSTGIVFFGPLAGAFVEPDEKQLKKSSDVVQYSVFAAGPFANALTALVALIILLLVVNPLTMALVTPVGFSFAGTQEGLPAEISGIEPGVIYTEINNITINTSEELMNALTFVRPGETVYISNDEAEIAVVTTQHPDNSNRGYLGVTGVMTEHDVKEGVAPWTYKLLMGIYQFLFWIFTLSIGLGAFNLLPLGPVDGGRMIQRAFKNIFGEKKGNYYWAKLGTILVVIIIFLIVYPILRGIF